MAPVKYFFASAGLLMSVMADYVSFAEWPASLTAGQPVTLKWVGGSDAVSIPYSHTEKEKEGELNTKTHSLSQSLSEKVHRPTSTTSKS